MKGVLGSAAAFAAAALVFAVAGGAATLPGGTALDVSFTSPTDGQTVPLAPLGVSGQASVGKGAAVADTTLIYIIDVSGSTADQLGGSLCPNQNVYDTVSNTTLDCELLSVRNLNQAAIGAGTVAKIGMIAFAQTASTLDLDPSGTTGTLTAPGANTYSPPAGAGTTTVITPANNLDWVTQSAYVGTLPLPPLVGWPGRGPSDGFTLFTLHDTGAATNYEAAMQSLQSTLSLVTTPQTLVVMLSDGIANVNNSVLMSTLLGQVGSAATAAHTALTIDTFAVGSPGTNGATCGGNPPANTLDGSLLQIAQFFHGTCTLTNNPGTATTVVPAVIASQLTGVSLTVDGAATPVTVTPTLPQTGPVTVDWNASVPTLTPGVHKLCATSTGKDGAGTGSAGPTCIAVTVKAPPAITLTGGDDPRTGLAGTIPEGGTFPVGATVSGDFTSSTWSASGGTGHCTPADPSALNTTFTCDDDGVYTLTLSVSDGVNPPVSMTEHLQVTNVAPTATLTLVPSTVPLSSGTTVAQIPITDPGADTWTCVINWGDGTTDTFTRPVRACDMPHTYTAAGPFPVHVQVTDDDGGTFGVDAGVVVQGPPDVTGVPTDGPSGFAGEVFEGSPFAITGVGSATATSFHWDASPGRGVCTFTDPNSPNPSVTCTNNDLYTLTLTATDAFGQVSRRSFHLLVHNVAPIPTLTLTPTDVPLSAANVHAHVDIADPGADRWECAFDWGDGTSTTTALSSVRSCDADHVYTAAGSFHVIVTAADDDGGTGTTFGDVNVKAPPSIGGGFPADGPGGSAGTVDEGSTFPIPGSVAGASSLHWSSSGGTGHCTFSSDSSIPTSIKCDDNGLYTLTLTASDSFGQAASSSFHLQVNNVAPTLTVSGPASGSSARTVTFNGIVTDPGANDVLQCTINWGDGTTDTVPVAGGFCNATHSYDPSRAAATITATASDDDGGVSAPRTIALNFNRPPVCIDVRSNIGTLWPPNHQLVLVSLGGATDPDGDAVRYLVTGVRQDEALTGGGSGNTAFDAKLASGGSVWIRAERAGTGDGRVYTIAFTVTDSNGASCSGTTTVAVPHDQTHAAVKTPGVSVDSLG